MKLADVRRFAMSLPEVTEAPHFHHASFRIRGKIFMTVPPQEQHLHVFVAEDERDLALALDAEFLERLLWGGKVVGLRVALGAARPAVVKRLVRQAWLNKAPRALTAKAGGAAS